MLTETKYLGEMHVEEDKVIRFPYGIPGFIDETEFALLDFPGNEIFHILQSLTTPELAFIVTNPYHFYKDYIFDLDEQIITNLQIKEPTDITVLSVVTVKEPFKESTMNLKAPIIIHLENRVAKQYILNKGDYVTKTPLAIQKKSLEKGE